MKANENGSPDDMFETQRCDACWIEYPKDSEWAYFNFKHLKPVFICKDCLPKYKDHLETLQTGRL